MYTNSMVFRSVILSFVSLQKAYKIKKQENDGHCKLPASLSCKSSVFCWEVSF